MTNIPQEIFRAYDIRGIVNEQLNSSTVYQLGLAIGNEVFAQGAKSIITARDGRLSGPSLNEALQAGLLDSGCQVIDIGIVPTPVLYFATHTLNTQCGVMLTGSHNPANYNGLKIVIQGKALTTDAIMNLYHRIKNNRLTLGKTGRLTSLDIRKQYLDAITQSVQLQRPLKIVIDCGNGVTGELAPLLFKRLGCEVISLYDEIDGNFPNHHPDPSVPENLTDLIHAVKQEQADIGLAFDGDGDRLGVITNLGEIIWADRQLAIFAKDILSRHPNSTIVYDVKCSKHLTDIIKQYHGIPHMYKTGHSLIKAKMQEMQALLAGEMSGHIYFKERWFGFDDGLYAGVRLLEILAQQSGSSAALFATIPNSPNTPELKLAITEDRKADFMQKLIISASFADAEINHIDGLRADFKDGWGLIRPSNTTPYLILRFEADNEDSLTRIKQAFRLLLLTVDASLTLPF